MEDWDSEDQYCLDDYSGEYESDSGSIAALRDETVNISDLNISIGLVRHWHSEAYLADDELSDSDDDSVSQRLSSTQNSPDPMFPFARPVSSDLLATGMATVRLVPKTTSTADMDPPLPFQGDDRAILERMGSMNITTRTRG